MNADGFRRWPQLCQGGGLMGKVPVVEYEDLSSNPQSPWGSRACFESQCWKAESRDR